LRDFSLHSAAAADITITVIQDTDGNVFGGFTPVEWKSQEWNGIGGTGNSCPKADDSLKDFLFRLKNPQNIAPIIFA
jgi:hypothetical protein